MICDNAKIEGLTGPVKVAGKNALVVGLASTGIAAAKFLKKCGISVCATDAKPASELPGVNELKDMGVNVQAGGHPDTVLNAIDLVIVSPGVPCNAPLLEKARKNKAKVISDIELAYYFIDAPVIAIAGTNGKSTVTTLIGEILKRAGKKPFVGGNLGTPAIEYANGDFGPAVLEISSFHLETTETFNPHIGILLNITEDHLDRYRDFDEYAGTKFRLFANQGANDFAVLNVNDPVINKRLSKGGLTKARVIPFAVSGALSQGLYLKDNKIIFSFGNKIEEYPLEGFSLKGLHNIENMMAAIGACRAFGISKDIIVKTLAGFKGLSHRMEFVRELEGVSYVDDSKGTNIGALAMALKGTGTPVVLIAGGRDKGGDYKALEPLVREKVKAMVLIGEARFKMNESLGGLTDTVMAGSLEGAVNIARSKAAPGDTVLLCPACSSFDMFKSYKERGERFKAIVQAL